MIVAEKITRDRIKGQLSDGDMTIYDMTQYIGDSQKAFYRKVLDRMVREKLVTVVTIGSGMPLYYHLVN